MVHTDRLQMTNFGVWPLYFVWPGLQSHALNSYSFLLQDKILREDASLLHLDYGSVHRNTE